MPNTQKQTWLAMEISVASEAAEAIEFALSEAGALGTEINLLGMRQLPETICVVGYFNQNPNKIFLQKEIAEALRIYGFSSDAVKDISQSEVENRDWLAEWKKHWQPTETEKFIIAPPWSNIKTTDKILIHIEPNMAFGTGTHETTRLCLKAIEENYSGESFFDIGTGTGILAIAAAKIKFKVQSPKSQVGKSESMSWDLRLGTWDLITACDIDEDSIKIAKENARLNSVDGINFYVGSVKKDTPQFDFICANLTADVIVPLLPLLIAKAEKFLVLSGILKEQESLIVSELKKFQVTNFKIQTDGEWISILMENGKRKMEN